MGDPSTLSQPGSLTDGSCALGVDVEPGASVWLWPLVLSLRPSPGRHWGDHRSMGDRSLATCLFHPGLPAPVWVHGSSRPSPVGLGGVPDRGDLLSGRAPAEASCSPHAQGAHKQCSRRPWALPNSGVSREPRGLQERPRAMRHGAADEVEPWSQLSWPWTERAPGAAVRAAGEMGWGSADRSGPEELSRRGPGQPVSIEGSLGMLPGSWDPASHFSSLSRKICYKFATTTKSTCLFY